MAHDLLMTPGQDRGFRNVQEQAPVILSEVAGWV